jgi:hypothetical protein
MITIRIASPNDVKLIQEIAIKHGQMCTGNSFLAQAGLFEILLF